jgi:hypothetical protein
VTEDLRVFRHLGFFSYGQVEIQAIEFVEDGKSSNKGESGYAEDHEYFGELANI